jgi:hypothetical protein
VVEQAVARVRPRSIFMRPSERVTAHCTLSRRFRRRFSRSTAIEAFAFSILVGSASWAGATVMLKSPVLDAHGVH